MSDEETPRERPQYGEYATPEQQRARIQQPHATDALAAGLAPEPVPVAPPTSPAGPATTTAARPTRPADRIITVALLVYGLFTVVTAVPQLLDYTAFASQWMDLAGIDATFTDDAQGALWGAIATGVFIGGWILTAVLSWLSLRARRMTWWIPLVGAIVTFVIASICLSIPLVTDPTIVNQLTSP